MQLQHREEGGGWLYNVLTAAPDQTRPEPTCCVLRCSLGKAKLQLSPCTPCRRMETAHVWLHSFLISTLYGGKWLASRYGHFTTNKISLLLNINLGGVQTRPGRFGEKQSILLPPGIEHRFVQSVLQSLRTEKSLLVSLWFSFPFSVANTRL